MDGWVIHLLFEWAALATSAICTPNSRWGAREFTPVAGVNIFRYVFFDQCHSILWPVTKHMPILHVAESPGFSRIMECPGDVFVEILP